MATPVNYSDNIFPGWLSRSGPFLPGRSGIRCHQVDNMRRLWSVVFSRCSHRCLQIWAGQPVLKAIPIIAQTSVTKGGKTTSSFPRCERDTTVDYLFRLFGSVNLTNLKPASKYFRRLK